MKKINKCLLKLSLLIGLTTFGSAHAGFQSLHQFPVTHSISGPLKTDPLIGFKDQFAPFGVPGCLIGYPEFRSRCQTVYGGFSFAFDGYTNYQEFKVYIPAGTTFFGVSGYMPQSAQYGVAVKLGSPPTRTALLTEAGYQAAKSEQNRFHDFAKLLAGEERIFVHDGGGAISLSGIARLNPPLATGQWLYFRTLTENTSVAGLGAIYEVNRDQYRTAYETLNFGTDGDPSDGGNSPIVPAPTGIAQIKENAPTADANGNLVLNFTLKRPASETESTNRTSFWIAAYVPAGFLPEEAWFFLTPGGWQQLTSTNPYTVAYQNSQAAQPEKAFNISTGLSAADLRHFNAQLHFGYMGNDGQLKDMGVIWSGN
jgi:hypothetical protein